MGKTLQLGKSVTGVQHSIEIDADGDGFTLIEFTPDEVETEILDNCARMRSLHQNSRSHFKHAGQIPIGLHAVWKKEWREKYSDTWTWQTFLAMKLNSREYENLRTGHKRGGSMKLPTGLKREL